MNALAVVLPVRFSGGGVTMQTTSSRISAEALFVRCMVAPKEGSTVQVQVTFPGVARPVEFNGTVLERVASGTGGKETGFWMRFGDLHPEASRHLDLLLRSRGQPGVPAAMKPQRTVGEASRDTRTFARVRSRIQVGWTSSREFLVAFSENISRGGIFVATLDPPQLREVIELSLELPDGLPAARVQAEVVQRTTREEAAKSGRSAGIGLQFVGGDDDFRRRLDRCLEALLETPKD